MFEWVLNTPLWPVTWNELSDGLFFIINSFVSGIDMTQKRGSEFIPHHWTMLQKVLHTTKFGLHYVSLDNENYQGKTSTPVLIDLKILNANLVPNCWLSWLTATDICVTIYEAFCIISVFLGSTEMMRNKNFFI